MVLYSRYSLLATQLYPEQFAKQIRARLNAAKLRLTEAAYELLLANCQGNLFAAKQAIERLTIHPQAHNIIDETLLTKLLDNFSQFNTFALSNAILGADWLNVSTSSVPIWIPGITVPSMCLSGHRRYLFGSHEPTIREEAWRIMEKPSSSQ